MMRRKMGRGSIKRRLLELKLLQERCGGAAYCNAAEER
jgi:hypothetical protein